MLRVRFMPRVRGYYAFELDLLASDAGSRYPVLSLKGEVLRINTGINTKSGSASGFRVQGSGLGVRG
jgi:hypothetical protein